MNASQAIILPGSSQQLDVAQTYFVGIGAQKSGTTWLTTQFWSDPNVHLPRKELNYWGVIRAPHWEGDVPKVPGALFQPQRTTLGRQIDSLINKVKNRLAPKAPPLYAHNPYDHSNYHAFLRFGYQGQTAVGEFSPLYALCSSRTFAEIFAQHHNTRFLFLMRDPVQRLWSGVRHRYRWQLRKNPDEDFILDAFDAALDDPYHLDFRRSNYIETLTQLDAAVPANRVLTLFYEDLFSADSAARIGDFLGLPNFQTKPDERVLTGVRPTVKLTEPLKRKARERLSATYDGVSARFNGRLPEAWKKYD